MISKSEASFEELDPENGKKVLLALWKYSASLSTEIELYSDAYPDGETFQVDKLIKMVLTDGLDSYMRG